MSKFVNKFLLTNKKNEYKINKIGGENNKKKYSSKMDSYTTNI